MVGVDSLPGIAVEALVDAVAGAWRGDVDNPAVEAFALGAGIREIVEGGAFFGN